MEYDLINTIVFSLVAAFVCGVIAKLLRFPALLGYLVAGIIVGPHSPGYVADVAIAKQLAEIGIILLMFGVGLHFSISDLLKVRKIALPGALFQMLAATLMGALLMKFMGHDWLTNLIYGLSLSVASTVVLLRTLEQRRAVDTETGKIAIGWLIVEDVAIVFALVLFPVITDLPSSPEGITVGLILKEIMLVFLKISVFVALMLVIGRKVLPWLIVIIARTKSSELTTLGTLAIALGFAFVAYTFFDASFALGAFLAGLVLSESEIGAKAAEKSLPMRDAFAVLFFVSVGMLFNPMIVLQSPVMVIMTIFVIIIGKGLAAIAVTNLFKQPKDVSYSIALSLAQIGEFSFILAGMALYKGVITDEIYNLILAGALFSIAINPFLFKLLDKYYPPVESQKPLEATVNLNPVP